MKIRKFTKNQFLNRTNVNFLLDSDDDNWDDYNSYDDPYEEDSDYSDFFDFNPNQWIFLD